MHQTFIIQNQIKGQWVNSRDDYDDPIIYSGYYSACSEVQRLASINQNVQYRIMTPGGQVGFAFAVLNANKSIQELS